MADEPITQKRATVQGMSRGEIIGVAQKREAMLMAAFKRQLEHEQWKLNGLMRLMGCMVERLGEQAFDFEAIGDMDPGRVWVRDESNAEAGTRTWTVGVRDDASKPMELYDGPENMPEEVLDLEKMAADGVTEVKVYDA